MSEELAFLQQLQNNIFDDDTRLVYADWLDEHGEVKKSLYLRSEIKLSRLTEESPGYSEAHEEWQRLHDAVERDWMSRAGKRFDVVLFHYAPHQKISYIKVIRELTNLGLGEAKHLSETLPAAVLRLVTRHQAEDAAIRLRAAGRNFLGSVKVVPSPEAVSQAGYASRVQLPGPPSHAAGPFNVVIRAYRPPLKIQVIKLIRELTGLGLRESKDLSEALPATVFRGLSRESADQVRQQFGPGVEVDVVQTASEIPHGGGARDVVLRAYPPEEKIAVIRLIRELTGAGLAEAEALAENLPATILAQVSPPVAEEACRRFAGIALVALRDHPNE